MPREALRACFYLAPKAANEFWFALHRAGRRKSQVKRNREPGVPPGLKSRPGLSAGHTVQVASRKLPRRGHGASRWLLCVVHLVFWYAAYNMQYSVMQYFSGPEIGLPGRIVAGLLPAKNRSRPSGRRFDFRASPVAVRPKSGPEGRLTDRRHW